MRVRKFFRDDPRFIRRAGRFAFVVFLLLYLVSWWNGRPGHDLMGNPLFPDFSVFYIAGDLVREGQWPKVYDQNFIWEQANRLLGENNAAGYYFLYPPFVAWMARPLALLTYAQAAWGWFAFNLVLGFFLAFRFPRLMGLEEEWRQEAAAWLFLVSIPFWRTVLFGQNSLCLLAIFYGFLRSWKRQDYFTAGMILSLALYKPQFCLGLLAWVIIWKQWRVLMGWITGAILLGLYGSLHGLGAWVQWIDSMRLLQSVREHYEWFHSIHNAFQFWGGAGGGLEKIVWMGVVAICGAALIRQRLMDRDPLKGLGLAVLGSFLLLPRVAQYDLVLAFPLFLGWWKQAEPKGWAKIGIASALFYFSDMMYSLKIPLLSLLGIFLLCQWCKALFFTHQSPFKK